MNDSMQQMFRKLTENITNQTKLMQQQGKILGQHENLLKLYGNKLEKIQNRLDKIQKKQAPSNFNRSISLYQQLINNKNQHRQLVKKLFNDYTFLCRECIYKKMKPNLCQGQICSDCGGRGIGSKYQGHGKCGSCIDRKQNYLTICQKCNGWGVIR